MLNLILWIEYYPNSNFSYCTDGVGIIYTSTSLDYEETSSYELEVVAYDLGEIQQTAVTKVWIDVIDLPDEQPKFDQDVYNIDVPEHTNIGDVVFVVSAGRGLYFYTIIGKNPFVIYYISFENQCYFLNSKNQCII